MAVRRGVAVGGDGRLLSAAAGAARHRCAADAVADAGAVRPAAGAGRGGALRERSWGRCGATPTTRTRRGCAPAGHETLAREVERSWGDYERALERFTERGGDLLRAFAPHAQWTSSATHAVLPLLATDAGVRAQVQSGVDAHRRPLRRQEGWRGGFWLPECAYAPWLDPALADAGVRSTCVELTGRFGLGAREHLRPLVGEDGVTLVPIDRATMSLVWSDGGYPAERRLPRLPQAHRTTTTTRGATTARPTTTSGRARSHRSTPRTSWPAPASACAATAPVCPGAAWRCARWIPSCSATGGTRGSRGWRRWSRSARGRGSSWCASTTRWTPGAGFEPDAARGRHAAGARVGGEQLGRDGDLSTWSGPQVAELAFATRAAELQVVAAGAAAGPARGARAAGVAGERLDFHDLSRSGRALRARALSRGIAGARAGARRGRAQRGRGCATSP